MAAQRAETCQQHYQQLIKQNDAKWDQKFIQLLKRLEAVEKEKNDAVCRYAAREAQLMRLQARIEELEMQKNILSSEKNTLQGSTEFQSLQNMKHSLAEVEQQLAVEKEASKKREEQNKLAVKHLEASQTVLTELRSRLESVESQLALEQMEKEECQEKLRKTQAMLKALERQHTEKMDAVLQKTKNQEELFNSVCDELGSLRSRNSTLSQQLNDVAQANAQLQAESQQLTQELGQAHQTHHQTLEKLESLEELQRQLNSNLRRVKLAEIAAIDAAAERDQAEAEATECRKQAERMLEITEQLTDKNSSLTAQQEMLKCKNLQLNQRVETLESSVSAYEKHIADLERDLGLLKVGSCAEIERLRQEIDAYVAKEQKLNAVIHELRNEREILKKKNLSSLKELRAEMQHLRKQQCRSLSDLSSRNPLGEDDFSFTPVSNDKLGPSVSSRASSIISSTDMCLRTTNYTTLSLLRVADYHKSRQLLASSSSDGAYHVQQHLIEKIVKLQRQLAKRQNKVEFLEGHVRQCTQELLKKTKIIQNYALREEASLLLPENNLNKLLEFCEAAELPHGRSDGNSSTSSSLMGNLFASGINDTRISELKFTAEVNSRLQAVLEDALYKNITLKNNINSLSEEISRLSRENRQLALSKII